MAAQQSCHRREDRADEEHNRDDDGGVYSHYLRDLFVISDRPHGLAERGHSQQEKQEDKTGERHPDGEDVEPLDVAAQNRPRSAAEGIRKRTGIALEDDGGRGGDGQEYAQRGDEHDERRPRALAHVHVETSIECHGDDSRHHARHSPTDVKVRLGCAGDNERAVSSQRHPDAPRHDQEGRGAQCRECESSASEHGPPRDKRRQDAYCRAEDDVGVVGETQNEAHVAPRADGQESSDCVQNPSVETRPQLVEERLVQRPRDHSGGHGGKYGVHVGVRVVVTAEAVLRPQVEDAVGSDGCRRTVVQIEEPYGAVDDGKAHREERVDGAYGQTVEGELHGLVGRFGDLPGELRDYGHRQRRR